MKKINFIKSEEAKDENSFKLLGKKRFIFSVKNKLYNKHSSPEKDSERNLSEGRWSYEEQIKFIECLSKIGTNWKKFKEIIKTRTLPQIRSHAQKFFNRLKRCKNAELGIDFTSKSIKNIKDMINHIKSVNSNYDIKTIFLFLYDTQQKNEDFKIDDFYKKKEIDTSSTSPQTINKDNMNSGSNNLNKINLLDSLNKINNNLNIFTLNCISKSLMANALINKLFNDYFQNISKALSNVVQSSIINNPNSSNNSNINEILNNLNIL